MVNWVQQGLNCAFITLELSEDLCSMRMDAMMTNTASKDIFRDIDNVEMKVKLMAKKAGELRIKYLPAQSTVNDVRAYVKELEVQTGIKIDAMCIDYLDLLMPITAKVSPNDLFVKDKYVSEEIRNLGKELGIIMVSASQLNRCLALDTIVTHKQKGNIQIQDINVGDYIKNATTYVKVDKVYNITEQDVYRITTKSGKVIECSAKHKFPTNSGLKDINNGLQVGDKLLVEKL